MSNVSSTEKAPKKRKGLLGGNIGENLGLGEGADEVAPRLRPKVEQMGPIGMPFAANIGLEARKAQGLAGNLMGNPATLATAKMTGQSQQQVINKASNGLYR